MPQSDPFLNPRTIDGFKSAIQAEQERLFLASQRYPWVRRLAKDKSGEWFPIPTEDFVRLYADYYCDGDIHHARNTIQQPNKWEGINEDYNHILDQKRKQAEWQQKVEILNLRSAEEYPARLIEALNQPSQRTREIQAFMHTISVQPKVAWRLTKKIFQRTIEKFKYEIEYIESPDYTERPRLRLLTEEETFSLLQTKLVELDHRPTAEFRSLLEQINSRTDTDFRLVICFDMKTEESSLRSVPKNKGSQEFEF